MRFDLFSSPSAQIFLCALVVALGLFPFRQSIRLRLNFEIRKLKLRLKFCTLPFKFWILKFLLKVAHLRLLRLRLLTQIAKFRAQTGDGKLGLVAAYKKIKVINKVSKHENDLAGWALNYHTEAGPTPGNSISLIA
jgi:hypothetical protein